MLTIIISTFVLAIFAIDRFCFHIIQRNISNQGAKTVVSHVLYSEGLLFSSKLRTKERIVIPFFG